MLMVNEQVHMGNYNLYHNYNISAVVCKSDISE